MVQEVQQVENNDKRKWSPGKKRTGLSIFLGVVAASLIISATSCRQSIQDYDHLARVERGKYLVSIAGCDDCHTPWVDTPQGPQPDMERRLSGHPQTFTVTAPQYLPDGPWAWKSTATNTAFAGPWGISFAANLTPEENTGIGVWTEDMFMRTIREGRHWGVARPILPPMPWPAYRNMTDEDLKSVYAFLRTLKPIVNEVPEPILAPEPDEIDLAE